MDFMQAHEKLEKIYENFILSHALCVVSAVFFS